MIWAIAPRILDRSTLECPRGMHSHGRSAPHPTRQKCITERSADMSTRSTTLHTKRRLQGMRLRGRPLCAGEENEHRGFQRGADGSSRKRTHSQPETPMTDQTDTAPDNAARQFAVRLFATPVSGSLVTSRNLRNLRKLTRRRSRPRRTAQPDSVNSWSYSRKPRPPSRTRPGGSTSSEQRLYKDMAAADRQRARASPSMI